MKAKELIIDDYIVSELGNIYRVKGVRDLDGGEVLVSTGKADMWYDYRLIKPIPLTEEILKINGFEILHTNTSSLVEYNGYVILTKNQGDSAYYFASYGHYKICIMYVHQLQHALRLCGLNELADNFKVGGAE